MKNQQHYIEIDRQQILLSDYNPLERELAMFMGKVFLNGCKELWIFGNVISPGMQEEIKHATGRGLEVRYLTDHCEEVLA